MATITEDLVSGAEVEIEENSTTLTRVFIVEGINGTPSARTHLAAQDPGIPAINDNHPSIPDIQVFKKSAKMEESSNNIARVSVFYKILDDDEKPAGSGDVLQVGATTQSVQTNQFFNVGSGGSQDLMKVAYKYPGAEVDTEQVGTVLKQVPAPFIRITEKFPFNVLDIAIKFVGKIHSKQFGIDPVGSWLCTRITGDSLDGGVTYLANFEFQRSIKFDNNGDEVGGWDAQVIFIDPDTGNPPADILSTAQANKAIQLFRIYQLADFAEIGLSQDIF